MLYYYGDWGGVVRLTAHDGGSGNQVHSFLGTHSPREKFYEYAILLSRLLQKSETSRIFVSAGIGTFFGERLTPDEYSLEEFGKVPGFAWEIGFSSVGGTVGISILMLGNLNSEESQVGGVFSLSVGY